MDGRWAPGVIESWIDQVWDADKWLALFFADPLGVSDPFSVEVIGGAYSRIEPAWERTSAYAITLAGEGVFRALAPGTLVFAIGLCNSPFTGSLLARELVDPPRSYPTGGTFRIDVGEWVLGIQIPVGP